MREELREQLPLVLFDEDLLAGLQLFHIVFFENTHVSLDPFRFVDALFLHHPAGQLILANQQRHVDPPSPPPSSPDVQFVVRYLTALNAVKNPSGASSRGIASRVLFGYNTCQVLSQGRVFHAAV